MKQDIDISKILVLLQTNGKAALEKLQKMITTMNQSGIYDTRQLKEMSVLINACIPQMTLLRRKFKKPYGNVSAVAAFEWECRV